jgi:hypothetical protein
MTLRNWLRLREYNPETAVCVSLGTDGLKVSRDHLMSISVASHRRTPSTVYIMGAEPENTQAYTGVFPDYYSDKCVGTQRAEELLRTVVDAGEFMVTYRPSGFTIPWLEAQAPFMLRDVPVIDIADIFKMFDAGEVYPLNVEELGELISRLSTSLPGSNKGYSFNALCDRFLVQEKYENMITLEAKIHQLWDLWLVALDKSV